MPPIETSTTEKKLQNARPYFENPERCRNSFVENNFEQIEKEEERDPIQQKDGPRDLPC